jgi:Leucine-rich repeat (LRR) protein
VRLSLTNNQLTALPASIGRLHKLEELSLYSNSLKRLPDSFSEFDVLFCVSSIS